MALSEIEIKRIERAVSGFMDRKRPPPHIRPKLDLQYRIEGQSLELFEIRPFWADPAQTIEAAVAKATYVKRTGRWKIYWQRADLKWHRYDPDPEVESIEDVLAVVEADQYACFFG